jgi:hypothetical protein
MLASTSSLHQQSHEKSPPEHRAILPQLDHLDLKDFQKWESLMCDLHTKLYLSIINYLEKPVVMFINIFFIYFMKCLWTSWWHLSPMWRFVYAKNRDMWFKAKNMCWNRVCYNWTLMNTSFRQLLSTISLILCGGSSSGSGCVITYLGLLLQSIGHHK